MCVPSELPFLTWQCLSTDTGYTCHQVRDADVDVSVLGQTPYQSLDDRQEIASLVWLDSTLATFFTLTSFHSSAGI